MSLGMVPPLLDPELLPLPLPPASELVPLLLPLLEEEPPLLDPDPALPPEPELLPPLDPEPPSLVAVELPPQQAVATASANAVAIPKYLARLVAVMRGALCQAVAVAAATIASPTVRSAGE
jgi:hypothetical protein